MGRRWPSLTGRPGQLYHRDLGQLDAVPIPGTENAWYPFFSPDGEWVGYFDRGDDTLKKTRLDGGAAQTLVSVPGEAPGARVGVPTGPSSCAIPGWTGCRGSGTRAGRWNTSRTPKAPPFTGWTCSPTAELYWPTRLEPGTARSLLSRWETGERTTLFPGTTPRYVSTDHVVFWREDALWAVRFDPDRLTAIGPTHADRRGCSSGEQRPRLLRRRWRPLVISGGW